jgi:hypothetical protein
VEIEYWRAIDFLINLNLKQQYTFAMQEQYVSKQQWAKEFATVRCDVGRQIGKTSYIKARANYGDLIIVGKYHLKKEMMHPIPSADVITHADLEVTGFVWPRYSRIYIDEPGKLNLDMVYDIFARDTRQLFIILGT